jgi:pimeloyl-ACP methyl ester carboxylesterase
MVWRGMYNEHMSESSNESNRSAETNESLGLEPAAVGPLPPDDSFSTDMTDAAEAENTREYELEHARVLVDRATAKTDTERRMQPSEHYDDDTFQGEMAQAEQYTARNGLSYGVFRLNRDRPSEQTSPRRPVVLLLGLIGDANSGKGRDYVHEAALHNQNREIIVIQREGMGSSSKPDKQWIDKVDVADLGQGRLDVLDQMGIDEFDVVGYSFGAVAAVGLAREAGARAHTLVTLGLPGFDDSNSRSQLQILKSIGKEMIGSPGRVAREMRKRALSRSQPQPPQPPSEDVPVRSLRERAAQTQTVKGLGKVMLQTPQVQEALTHLSPSTHWTDIVGNADPYTDWPDHVAKARNRNPLWSHVRELSPSDTPDSADAGRQHFDRGHNSDVMLLTDRASSHIDMSKQRALMAEIAARALDRQDRRESSQA